MKVKLISLTRPLDSLHPDNDLISSVDGVEPKQMSAEDLIAYCARVSNPKNQMNTATAPKLIKFLIKHKHWSPFELANMCVEIETNRAIAAQILRHRSFSFQEFSQRYSAATEVDETQLRRQAEKNRQSSEEEINPMLTDDYKNIPAYTAVRAHCYRSIKLYDELIESGVAKECARAVLPLSTKTTLYMNGSVRSWIHYIQLRTDVNTQKEHRDVANAIKVIFVEQFPNVAEALEWSK